MEQPSSSFHLMERIKKGDRDALSLILASHRRRLAIVAHYRLGPQLRGLVEIDDILQETLLRAYLQFNQFTYRTPGSFMSWITRIMDHVIADTARHHGRKKRQATQLLPFRSESNPQGPEPADSRTPSRLLAQDEGLRALMRELDELPDDYREVILLARIEGLSTREVAERMGKSREAVALLLHRAVKRFRMRHNLKEAL